MKLQLLISFLLLSSSALYAMQQEAPASPELVISNSEFPVYLRIRTGDGPSLAVFKAKEKNYIAAGNTEVFLLPKEQEVRIPLNQISYPLRLRAWSAEPGKYLPTMDIDANGRPVESSKDNRDYAIASMIIDSEDALREESPQLRLDLRPRGEFNRKGYEMLKFYPDKPSKFYTGHYLDRSPYLPR